MKYEEFIITQKWFEEIDAYEYGRQVFSEHFPDGGEALKVLKHFVDLGYKGFSDWLVKNLPPIYPPLELNILEHNTFIGDLLYPGDAYIKGDISTQGIIHTQGSFKVDGKLTINKFGHIFLDKGCVNAGEIELRESTFIMAETQANKVSLSGFSSIQGCVVANRVSLRDSANITGNTETKVINLNGGNIYGDVDADIVNLNSGRIWGSVDANEIYNDGGFIWKNVNTNKIENINNGKVGGKVTYKRSDEHK